MTSFGSAQQAFFSLQVPQEGNPEQATGSYIGAIVGVRISTPIFGTGFNFCVGTYAALLQSSTARHASS